ncbi:MAG: putative metal-dependent hydrolase [Gemmatimonadaceae bacterium]|nr:putative metal-dependent hydrolase [Gemmatimonadaceae bacterium]
MESLRFPVGRLDMDAPVSEADHQRLIDEIASTPVNLRKAVSGLSADQMATPYREGGWTVSQLVHHVPESHMQAFSRCKFALTEEKPIIKPYDEAKWSETPDVASTRPEVSLTLLDALQERWVNLLRGLSAEQMQRAYFHPDHGRLITIERMLAMYAWHGRHHVAHVTKLRERNGW